MHSLHTYIKIWSIIITTNLNQLLDCSTQQLKQLRSINLSRNDLGYLKASTFQTLCETLGQCSQLQSIDLGQNYLGYFKASTFQTLCDALAQCSQLQSINLSCNYLNRLGASAFEALCGSLQKCFYLTSIICTDSFFEPRRKAAIKAIVQSHKNLVKLEAVRLTLALMCPDEAVDRPSMPLEDVQKILSYTQFHKVNFGPKLWERVATAELERSTAKVATEIEPPCTKENKAKCA